MAEWTPAVSTFAHDISLEDVNPIGLWRPFLNESRAAIDLEVLELGLQPIEDPSNADRALRRNALRHEVLPVMERHFPGATAALARYAELAADDDRVLQEMVERLYLVAVDPGGYFRLSAMHEQPLSLRRRLLREWVLRATGLEQLSAERTEALLSLVEKGEPGKCVEVGAGWRVRYTTGALLAAVGSPHVFDREKGER
jgi:tRNA(Ile)-lysidine synthase TilS/MesJ